MASDFPCHIIDIKHTTCCSSYAAAPSSSCRDTKVSAWIILSAHHHYVAAPKFLTSVSFANNILNVAASMCHATTLNSLKFCLHLFHHSSCHCTEASVVQFLPQCFVFVLILHKLISLSVLAPKKRNQSLRT